MKIELNNLSKNFNNKAALNSVSTVFEQGYVHGVIGSDGAGKTTLMRLLSGLIYPTRGSINYIQNGEYKNFKQIKENIAYFPQEPSLYPDLSCMEHLRFFADLYDMSDKEFNIRTSALLKATGMEPFINRPAGKLSGGMYKKLGLMCVLLNRPSLLLLDEPTIGVDPVSRRDLWDLVYSFTGNNMTVIMTTSYMDEAERCAKVHMLEQGKLIAAGSPAEIKDKFKAKDFTEIFFNYGKQ